MKLTIPTWLIRTLKYGVICGLSGLFLFVLGLTFAGVLIISESNYRDAYYQETVLHTVIRPDNQTIVKVIRNDYGKTCGAGVSVNIKFKDSFSTTIFNDENSCDASIRWLSNNKIKIESLANDATSTQNVIVDVTTIEHYFD